MIKKNLENNIFLPRDKLWLEVGYKLTQLGKSSNLPPSLELGKKLVYVLHQNFLVAARLIFWTVEIKTCQ